MRGGDDFVAGPETKSPQCDVDRVCAVCARDATLHAKRFRPRVLESVHVPSANVSRLGDHLGNGLVDLLFDRQVLRVEINEGDFHGKAAQKSGCRLSELRLKDRGGSEWD